MEPMLGAGPRKTIHGARSYNEKVIILPNAIIIIIIIINIIVVSLFGLLAVAPVAGLDCIPPPATLVANVYQVRQND